MNKKMTIAVVYVTFFSQPFKGWVSWGFWPNGEIRPSLSYKLILEREERNELNIWKEQLVICSSTFCKQKYAFLKNVENVQKTFKFKSNPTSSGQRH